MENQPTTATPAPKPSKSHDLKTTDVVAITGIVGFLALCAVVVVFLAKKPTEIPYNPNIVSATSRP